MAFNPLLEILQSEIQNGYDMNGTKIITTPYADDFNIITRNSRTHQRIINKINKLAKSMNLKLKPTKCRSHSICSGTPTTVQFKIENDAVRSVADDPHTFLGSLVSFHTSNTEISNYVISKVKSDLHNISSSLIRPEYKIAIYKRYYLPSIRFLLTVHDLTKTTLDNLDALTNKKLKEWAKIPQCGTPIAIYLKETLGITPISVLYKECQATAYTSSILKGDDKVQAALASRVERERQWVKRKSILLPIVETVTPIVEHINPTETQIRDPKILQRAQKSVKSNLREDTRKAWKEKLKTLVLQGNLLALTLEEELSVCWNSFIFDVPRRVMQFVLNSSIDTLPTKSNLVRWGKNVSDKCDLCGNRETLLHVLNYCNVQLTQGRYTWRHDNVLNVIHTALTKTKATVNDTPNPEIIVDLNQPNAHASSTIPREVIPTTDRPDLVLYWPNEKKLLIFELTVPFDLNISKAHEYKCNKYAPLIHDISARNFDVSLIAFEVGSRGLLTNHNFQSLKSLIKMANANVTAKTLSNQISKMAVVSSFSIFHARQDPAWTLPPLLQ